MRTKDLGFDGDRVVLAIQFKGKLDALQIEHLANEINSRPGLIQGVTGASAAPGFGGQGLPTNPSPVRKCSAPSPST